MINENDIKKMVQILKQLDKDSLLTIFSIATMLVAKKEIEQSFIRNDEQHYN